MSRLEILSMSNLGVREGSLWAVWEKDRALVMAGPILAALTQGSFCSSGGLNHRSQRVAPLPEADRTPGLFPPLSVLCILRLYVRVMKLCAREFVRVCTVVDRGINQPSPLQESPTNFSYSSVPVSLFPSLCPLFLLKHTFQLLKPGC